MKILELYSGIGGMHMALCESGIKGDVRAAIEISNIANTIYKHNFPNVNLLNLNIEGLTVDKIRTFDIDTILMSPPCQPFTRNGNQNDINDARTNSFQHILKLLPEMGVKNILVENVKGFENSEMRNILINSLQNNNFVYQEFILSPTQFGIPNSRHRYYCLATKNGFHFEPQELLLKSLPGSNSTDCFEIHSILENDVDYQKYCLSETILKKRINVLDICFHNSKRSCCFTKAYGRFIEGTGSVYTDNTETEVVAKMEKLNQLDIESEDYLQIARSLNLRFFTPREIARLMNFPDTFSFPTYVTERQKYMVLGNSINVKVVSELIKLFNYSK